MTFSRSAPEGASTQVARIETRLLVVNPQSGRGSVPEDVFDGFERLTLDGVRERLAVLDPSHDVIVAVWGGDGTMRAVAEAVIGTRAVLVPCPGGTHNHFARAARVEDLDAVRAVLERGEIIDVDVGRANGRAFLNNATIGWYAELVARRERFERRLPRRLAKALAAGLQVARVRRRWVRVDGRREGVWMVWVGNGQFSLSPISLHRRDELDDGVLDLRILRVHGLLPKVGAVAALLAGRIEESPLVERRLVRTCTIEVPRRAVRVALDGEVFLLSAPLVIRSSPRRLRLAVPPVEAVAGTSPLPSERSSERPQSTPSKAS